MKFDIDVSNLHPGCVIEQSDCEDAVGVRFKDDPDRYRLLLLNLKTHIERELKSIGYEWTLRTPQESIHILTHEEASAHNENRTRRAKRSIRKAGRLLDAVDVGQLSTEARKEHTRRLISQSRLRLALHQASRDLEPIPTRTMLPARK